MDDHLEDSHEDPIPTQSLTPPPRNEMSHVLDAIHDMSTRVTNIDICLTNSIEVVHECTF